MKVIKVSQLVSANNLQEVVMLTVNDGLWERLHRVFAIEVAESEPLQVWLDLYDEDGVDLLDGAICISADEGLWFLQEFCSRPKSEWGKIKQKTLEDELVLEP